MAEKAKETKATSKPLELVLDLDQLLIGDIETLENPKSTSVVIDLLDKAVTNVDIRTLPLSMLSEIRKELMVQLKALREDPNSDGLS